MDSGLRGESGQSAIRNSVLSRSCDSPPPSYGGRDCGGAAHEEESCEHLLCTSEEREYLFIVICHRSNIVWKHEFFYAVGKVVPRKCHRTQSAYVSDITHCLHAVHFLGLTCTEIWESNITTQELNEKIQEISKNLTVNKANLSSEIRKKTCAEDPRQSSQYMGVVAVVFIGVFCGLIMLVDCTSLLKWACPKFTWWKHYIKDRRCYVLQSSTCITHARILECFWYVLDTLSLVKKIDYCHCRYNNILSIMLP
jgi:hypothetical protein